MQLPRGLRVIGAGDFLRIIGNLLRDAEFTARGVVENLLSKLEPELEVIAGFL